MGMRLAFEVVSNGHHIALGFNKWGAYTNYAADITEQFIERWDPNNHLETDTRGRISYCECPHKQANDIIEWIGDRNGIDFSIKETWDVKYILSNMNRYDGTVIIDISKKNVAFDVFGYMEEGEMYDCIPDIKLESIEEIPEIVDFDEFKDYAERLETNELGAFKIDYHDGFVQYLVALE